MNKNIVKLICLICIIFSIILSSCNDNIQKVTNLDFKQFDIEIIGNDNNKDVDNVSSISIGQLLQLEQIKFNASFKRTTGLEEKFVMQGPLLKDVLKSCNINLKNYEAVGVEGLDGYYCLLTKELIDSTNNLVVGIKINNKFIDDEEKSPVMLGVEGQLGPYWVKKVHKIILYKKLPKREITSLHFIDIISKGIETYDYEYYGSKDKSIELIKIFNKFKSIDSKSIITFKSADGFKKNELVNIIKPNYYLKLEGVDSPTNIAPYIKLGMNVKNISWFATNKDAVIFFDKLIKYIDTKEIRGYKGIPISEILYELEFDSICDKVFNFLDEKDNIYIIEGADLDKGILVKVNNRYNIIWNEKSQLQDINGLIRVEVSNDSLCLENYKNIFDYTYDNKFSSSKKVDSTTSATKNVEDKDGVDSTTSATKKSDGKEDVNNTPENTEVKEEKLIEVDGEFDLKILSSKISKGYSLQDLKDMTNYYEQHKYSYTNNWPTKKKCAAKGINIVKLIKELCGDFNAIKVIASDGYESILTYNQLVNNYYYEDNKENISDNKTDVPSILCWNFSKKYKDFTKGENIELRLIVGQKGINDPNAICMVYDIEEIQVYYNKNKKWSDFKVNIKSSKVKKDSQIKFVYEDMDKVKIYYTLDGSEPNCESNIYNPSTSYFQPKLTKDITINKSCTIKAVAVGYGKENSKILEFKYEVED